MAISSWISHVNQVNTFQAKDKQAMTPLHLATIFGHKDIIKLMLNKGARIRERNKNESTTLHLAAAAGNTEVWLT